MSEVDVAAWHKLVEIAERQADASASLVQIQLDTKDRLRNIERNTGFAILALIGVIGTLVVALVKP